MIKIIKRKLDLRRNQSGAVAIIVAITITMLIGFTAMAVDVGYMYEVRRQLQSAADAAALAGAQEMMKPDTDDSQILTKAEEYAKKNDFPIDLGTSQELWMHTAAPTTEIHRDPNPAYVKVTVEKKVDLFFARIFGMSDTNIAAQAKAQVVYITGAEGLVPWGLIIITPTRATAQIEGGPEFDLDSINDTTFEGPVDGALAPRNSGYAATVKVYNGQDFPETVFPAAYIVTLNPTDPIQDIYFADGNNNFLKSGETTTLYAVSTQGAPKVRFNGKNLTMSLQSGNLYYIDLTAPSITNAVEYFPIDIDVGSGSGAFALTNAAVLVVGRSTYPVKSIVFDQTCFIDTDSSGLENVNTDVTVETNDYVFEEIYDLKVVQGGECGNFNALDFRYVWSFESGYTENIGLNDAASDYYENISGNYPGMIHIGDIIATQTGNLSAPTTAKALQDRFGTCASHTWDWWKANRDTHPNCNKIICVPVIEKIERLNGKSEVIVVKMAAFFIENIPDHGLNITGRFIEYVTPGSYTYTPPSGLYMESAVLVTPDF